MQLGWKASSFLAAIAFAGMNLFYRAEMDRGVSGAAALLAVFAVSIPTLSLILWSKGYPILRSKASWSLIAALGFFCYASNVFKMRGLALAPNPGYAEAISGFEVLLLTIASVAVFNSELTRRKLSGVLLCMAGFATLADWKSFTWIGQEWILFCLIAAVFQAIFSLVARRMSDLAVGAVQMVILLHLSAGAFFGTHMWGMGDHIPLAWPLPILYLGAAIFAIVGTILQLRGLALAPNPGYSVAIVRSSALLVAAGGWIVLGSELTAVKFVALLFCVAGVLLLVSEEKTRDRAQDDA